MKKISQKDLLILDEADWHLFDERIDLPKTYGILAMSATQAGIKGGNEERLLSNLKFQIIDSEIVGSIDWETPLEVLDLERFLDLERSRRARLIWCEDRDVQQFKKEAESWSYAV